MIDAILLAVGLWDTDGSFTADVKAPRWASSSQSSAHVRNGDCQLQIKKRKATATCWNRYVSDADTFKVKFKLESKPTLNKSKKKIKAVRPTQGLVPVVARSWCLPDQVPIRFSPQISPKQVEMTMRAAGKIGDLIGVDFTVGPTTNFQPVSMSRFYDPQASGSVQVITLPTDDSGGAVAWGGSSGEYQTGTVGIVQELVPNDIFEWVVLHELLHVAGLGHAPAGVWSVMSEDGPHSWEPTPTPEDVNALSRAQDYC